MQQNASTEPTYVPTGDEPSVAITSPAMRPPRWSGKKTAIVAALAISVATAGTVGAAAAVPTGTGAESGMRQGRMGGQMPPGMGQGMGPRQFGQQQFDPQSQLGQFDPSGQGPSQAPGTGQQGVDPGQDSSTQQGSDQQGSNTAGTSAAAKTTQEI